MDVYSFVFIIALMQSLIAGDSQDKVFKGKL